MILLLKIHHVLNDSTCPPKHSNVVLNQKRDYNIEQIIRLMSKQATQLANFNSNE